VVALADGSALVSDFGNNRVRRLEPSATIPGANHAPIRLVQAATQLEQAVAPGQLVTIYDAPLSSPQTRLTVAGKPALILYAKDAQINAQLPVDIPVGELDLKIFDDTDTLDYRVNVTPVAPGLFTAGSGRGQAAAGNEDGSPNAAANPAQPGSVITLYATGIPAGARVDVEIGSQAAEVLYVTSAAGAPGVRQVAARIPELLLSSGNVAVLVRVGVTESQTGVTVAVR
jgi:uncharacterized protein (TIGR03437 family)